MSQQKYCKAHPEERGQFYVTNQPWNKFCKTCALNRAICGYKIEKDLTPQEFQNKIILGSLVQELKASVQSCQKQSNFYSTFIERITAQLLPQLDPTLKAIESTIRELSTIKSQILDLYDTLINKKISKCHEIQSKYFMDSINFKQYLDNLETNYCDIILDGGNREEKGLGGVGGQVGVIKEEIQRARKYSEEKVISQDYFASVKWEFETKFKQFQDKINSTTIIGMKAKPSQRQLAVRQNIDQYLIEDKISIKLVSDDSKAFFSHRKKSTLSSLQENKCPSQFTHRPTNLTLKNSKRNNSIPLRSKNSKLVQP